MREVRLVGMADDGEHVLLTGPEMGTVALRIDDRLKAAVLRDRRLLDQLQVKSTSSLSVREMQSRLRAGASPEEIAADAGVTVEAVRRFAGPVLDERNHVTEAVRRLRTKIGTSLGDAVDPDTTWDAARRPDGTWTVTAAGAAGVALFSWDPAKRHLAPESELAVIALSDPREVTIPEVAPAPVALSLVREAASPTSTGQQRQPELAIELAPESDLQPELDAELDAELDLDPQAEEPLAEEPLAEANSEPEPQPDSPPEPATAAPRIELKRGSTDKQAEADGVAPGKRATVPSWDDILFGTRPPE